MRDMINEIGTYSHRKFDIGSNFDRSITKSEQEKLFFLCREGKKKEAFEIYQNQKIVDFPSFLIMIASGIRYEIYGKYDSRRIWW